MIGPVIPEIVIEELLAWHPVCGYPEPGDLVFASDYNFGKTPLWPDSLRTKILQPVARRVGIRKQIGWHTFRRTYSSLLAETGNDVKVVQELMRHSKLSTTMEVSTQAGMLKKRAAQRKAVDAILETLRDGAKRANSLQSRRPHECSNSSRRNTASRSSWQLARRSRQGSARCSEPSPKFWEHHLLHWRRCERR